VADRRLPGLRSALGLLAAGLGIITAVTLRRRRRPAAPPAVTSERQTPAVRILVVDDQPEVLAVLTEVIRREGHEVRSVGTAEEAIDVARTFRPQLLFLDLVMPGMSGNDLLRALRASGIRAPAVAVSGQPQLAIPAFIAVVSKPLNIPRLPRLIAVLARTASRDTDA
jgi:CheY-like chemotaxis protein